MNLMWVGCMEQLRSSMQVKVYLDHKSDRLGAGKHRRMYKKEVRIQTKAWINSLVLIKSYICWLIYLWRKKNRKLIFRCQYRHNLKHFKLSTLLLTGTKSRFSLVKKYLNLVKNLIWLASSNNHVPNLHQHTSFLRILCNITQTSNRSHNRFLNLNNNITRTKIVLNKKLVMKIKSQHSLIF